MKNGSAHERYRIEPTDNSERARGDDTRYCPDTHIECLLLYTPGTGLPGTDGTWSSTVASKLIDNFLGQIYMEGVMKERTRDLRQPTAPGIMTELDLETGDRGYNMWHFRYGCVSSSCTTPPNKSVNNERPNTRSTQLEAACLLSIDQSWRRNDKYDYNEEIETEGTTSVPGTLLL